MCAAVWNRNAMKSNGFSVKIEQKHPKKSYKIYFMTTELTLLLIQITNCNKVNIFRSKQIMNCKQIVSVRYLYCNCKTDDIIEIILPNFFVNSIIVLACLKLNLFYEFRFNQILCHFKEKQVNKNDQFSASIDTILHRNKRFGSKAAIFFSFRNNRIKCIWYFDIGYDIHINKTFRISLSLLFSLNFVSFLSL